MRTNGYAALALALILLLAAIYELFAIFFGGANSTISSITRYWTCRYPAIAVLLGMLVYHLVGECDERKETSGRMVTKYVNFQQTSQAQGPASLPELPECNPADQTQ